MRGRGAPAGRLARRLDRVADVLAIAEARLAERAALGIEHAVGGAAESGRACLPPMYILGVRSMPAAAGAGPGAALSLAALPALARRAARDVVGDQIFAQTLAAALAAEAALAIAAETRGGVEQVGRIDPDDARLDARGASSARLTFSVQTEAASP